MKGFVIMTQFKHSNWVHTLGPKTTDSFRAYQYACKKYPDVSQASLYLHDSYSSIYDNLNQFIGDLIIVPVAYRGRSRIDNWTDNNFRYSNNLAILDSFVLSTKKMSLIENLNACNSRAIIHPSTTIFIKQYEEVIGKSIEFDLADSKPAALSIFLNKRYQYTVASYDTYLIEKCKTVKVRNIFSPQMIWCVYKIM